MNYHSILSNIKIEYLKNQLLGKTIKIDEQQKGHDLENTFRYLIIQPENGGNSLENIEDNKKLFNLNKEKRKFEAHMVGIIELNIDENLLVNTTSFKEDFKKLEQYFKLNNYKIVGQNENYEYKYESINIKYDVYYRKFDEEINKNISVDICDTIKSIARYNKYDKNKSGSKSFHNFEIAEKIIHENEKIIKEKLKKKLTKEEVIIYTKKINLFYHFIKYYFNSSQKGFPNIFKFAKLKIKTNNNKEIFIFHILLNRELDGAYLVLNNYDFNEKSGLKEIDISEINEKGQIFKPNDVLLFELKDSSYKDTAAKCLYGNYEVLNSYIEYLKANNEFKDRQFYYIGIQEYNKSQILSDDIRSKIINQNKKLI